MRVLTSPLELVSLDAKGWRILREIIHNYRQPLSSIAKTCLLSRQSVEYRLKMMHEHNLLRGSRTVINIQKLGYKSYHIFMEVHIPSQEREIIARAQHAIFVNALIVYSGKYNLEISIMAKNEQEFLQYYHQLIEGMRMRDDQILILLQTICSEVLPSAYFPQLKEKKTASSATSVSNKTTSDKKIMPHDIQILHALSRDASKTNLSLAHELGVSKDTVPYHIKSLEQHKYILSYRPVVNYASLGLMINSLLIKLNYTSEGITRFEHYLKNQGSILWATKTVGYYDYIIYVITRNLPEFHHVINGIKEQFEDIIKTYEILFAFEELKYNFMADSILEEKKKED